MQKATPERQKAYAVLQRVLIYGQYANIVLRNVHEHVPFITEVVYGVLKTKRCLDFFLRRLSSRTVQDLSPDLRVLLEMALYELAYMRSQPYAVVSEAVKIAKIHIHPKVSGFVNAILRGFLRQSEELMNALSSEPKAVRFSVSDALFELLSASYDPEEVEDLLKISFCPPMTHLYLLQPSEEIFSRLGQRARQDGPFVRVEGYRHEALKDLYDDGIFTIMDRSTFGITDFFPSDIPRTILDMCAAPGGKTTLLAGYFPRIPIIAWDIHPHRAEILRKNMRRLRLNYVEVHCQNAVDAPCEEMFDLIVLDAPCTGSGVFGRKPELRYSIDRGTLQRLQKTQAALLESAYRRLAPGGRIIYSTCSILKDENMDRLLSFCHQSGAKLIGGKTTLSTREHEGFFAGALERPR